MTRPLRVVMPALTYVPGAMGGSETYVRALVAGLQAHDDIELTVLVSRAGAGRLGARSEHVVGSVRGGPSTVARLTAVARGFVADAEVRQLMAAADVVHYPFTVAVPRSPRRAPRVQTLLDVQHRDLPEMFSTGERWYRAAAYDAPARRATRVITISDFCRDRITAQLGILADRVDVAHLGVDLARFAPSDSARESFVFYPATAWPHKNHARLLDAVELVRRDRPELGLVLTGGRREALGALPAWVEHKGVVSDAEIAELYRRAACLVFPSMYEGFGLPVLEAMASGCPVAAAKTGPLPEICGDAATYFEPSDVASIAAAVDKAILDRARLTKQGLERASQSSWDRCVEEHVASYRASMRRLS